MRRQLQHEPRFTADPKFRELNDTLMRQQERINGEFDAAQLAMSRRLTPQAEVNSSGYLARPGLFVPVGTAGTLLLAKPTPDTAGQPLAIYNSSGGVVVLDPVDSTINGAAVGWIDAGLHVLYPDASGWYGGFSKSVAFSAASALTGLTTGALSVTAPTWPARGTDAMLVFACAQQGTSEIDAAASGRPMTRIGSNSLTTVRIQVFCLREHELASFTDPVIVVPDETTDLLGVALWVTGADQLRALDDTELFDSTGTTSEVPDIVTMRPGALVIDFIANDDETDTGTPGTDQTEIVDGSNGSATVSLQASYKAAARPTTTSMAWSALTAATNKAHLAIVIEPARAA